MRGRTPLGERVLFHGKGGGLVRPHNWRRRVFDPAATRAKTEKGLVDPRTGLAKQYWVWPPHSLRHRAATWQLNNLGLPPPLVADSLGLVDSAFTERMYMDRSRRDFGPVNDATRIGRHGKGPRAVGWPADPYLSTVTAPRPFALEWQGMADAHVTRPFRGSAWPC